ncbi:MAG: hypothetical protein J5795_07865 [Lachnospiraceae bacterium]|nr:hypothetical protein [Lachnospiraceae bacterium]
MNKRIMIPLIIVFVIAIEVGVVVMITYRSSKDAEKSGKTTPAVTEGASVGTEEMTPEEARREEDYRNAFAETFPRLENAIAGWESYRGYVGNVWYCTDNYIDDPQWNPFTKDENGSFYVDYRDAIKKMQESPETHQGYVYAMTVGMDGFLKKRISELENPPSDMKPLYEDLLILYGEYQDMKNIVLNPSGTREEYLKESSEALKKIVWTDALKEWYNSFIR